MRVYKNFNTWDAAKNLYVSQSSLSKQIAMIEEEVGGQLFIRTNRDVSLTLAGLGVALLDSR